MNLEQNTQANSNILPLRKQTQPDAEFEQYLRKHVRIIDQERKKQEWLIRLWVTLERRYRGITISDLCGYFSPVKYKEHLWTDIEVDPDKPDIHPIPIVKPAIRANGAAMLQADVSITVNSRVQNAQKENGASIGQKIADYGRKKFWQESTRTLLFDMMQKNSAGFKYIAYSKAETSEASVPNFGIKSMPAVYEYSCECGAEGEITEEKQQTDETETIPFQEIKCPNCQNPTYALQKESEQESAEIFEGYEKTEFGDFTSELLSPFFVTVDTLKTQGNQLDKARFVEVHRLKTRSELEVEFPQFDFGQATEWGYALKCYYALTNNDFDLLWGWRNSPEQLEEDLFEERDIFLNETAYANYRCPKDWDLRDKNGKIKFQILAGQTFKEALITSFGHNPKGFRFKWVNERLVDIVSPQDAPTNVRKCLTCAQFAPDSTSFWGIPFWEIVQMQDDITNLNTILVEFFARNSITNLLFDSEYWDRDDFAHDIVGSKTQLGAPVGNTVQTIPAPNLGNGINQHLAFLLNAADKATGVTEPMRGIPQPGQPAIAQRMQRDTAMGLLTAPLKSYSDMLVIFTRQFLEQTQDFWTLEQFQSIAAEYGEEWTEDDIVDFTEANIERDFTIEYRAGSEMPQSIMEREIKFNSLVGQLSGFMQTGAVSQGAISQIINRLCEFANVDIDVAGNQKDEQLATMMFRDLADICNQYDAPNQLIEQLRSEIIGEDEDGPFSSLDIQIKEILVEASIFISVKAENHDVHRFFYSERIKTILLKRKPNALLIAVLDKLIDLHEKAKVKAKQHIQAQEIEANQPAMEEQQQQIQQQQMDEEQQRLNQSEESARNKIIELSEAERQRQHELELSQKTDVQK